MTIVGDGLLVVVVVVVVLEVLVLVLAALVAVAGNCSVQVGHPDVPCSSFARNLGFTFSKDMSLKKTTQTTCSEPHHYYIELRRISSIHQYLPIEATKTMVCTFVCIVQARLLQPSSFRLPPIHS